MRLKLKIACIAALVFLACTEAGLRAFLGLGHPPLLHADPDYGYAFNANQDLRRFGRRVFYNEQGLRSEPLPPVKPIGELRILCIGDSVTNGGVMTDQSETYPYLLEAELRRAGIHARALNASAGSWGVENELAWLSKHGLLASDVVVLQVGTHDLAQRKSSGDKVGRDVNLPDKVPMLATWELIERYAWPRLARLTTSPPPPAVPTEEDLRICLSTIERMIQFVRANGAAPIVLLTPDREELQNPMRSEAWRANLLALTEAQSVPLVDMLKRLRLEPDMGMGAFRDGVHPNERGNRLMAQGVAREVLAHRRSGSSSLRQPAPK